MHIITAFIFSYALITVDASLYDFTTVGKCILGYNPWFDLLRHGCYCGFGNHGDVAPEDDYDACCRQHDFCYGNLTEKTEKKPKQCPNLLTEYLLPYWFHCEDHRAYCYVDPPYSWIPWWRSCGVGLCNCDSEMMECWKRVRDNSSDPRKRPDKRYCNISKSELPHPQDPGWMDYFENVVMFYEDLNRHRHEDAEKAKKKIKLEKERSMLVREWAQGHTRYPIRHRGSDENHVLPQFPQSPYSLPNQHPNEISGASAERLPWNKRDWHHPDWTSPEFVDNNV
ncbi:unnamed protein product [Cylicocyclus nassatus]|uniref:Phospholipase A2-like central domain-containing protein n=1 Tax=Cylicocyclus nassatus TaxID=53992 RepID=A0AA36H8A9_CYLNA|nr:unnamed protein product [Cylicocyclus nassatus]